MKTLNKKEMSYKSRFKRRDYWEALLIVRINQFNGTPTYNYEYWKSRLDLIKKGKI
ncbi:MAG: hypothetical protein OEM04_05520 [Flavobacteriaceae bacterium]|nr:hypothetical protein [Flavobacteriaceae bacterium]